MNCRNLLKHAKSNLFRESEEARRSFFVFSVSKLRVSWTERQAKCLGKFNFNKKDKKWIVLPASAKCRLNCLCLCLTVTECPSGCLVNDPIPKADSLLWSIFDHDGNTRLEACCSHKLVQFSLLAYFFFFRYFFGQTNTGPYSHVEKWCGFISTSDRSPENDMIKTKEVEKKCVLW